MKFFHVFIYSEADEQKKHLIYRRNTFFIINDEIQDHNSFLEKLNLNIEKQLIFFKKKIMKHNEYKWVLLKENEKTDIKIWNSKVN